MIDDTILIIICLAILAFVIIAFTKESWDYLGFAILGSLICAILVMTQSSHAFDPLEVIEFQPLLFIFGMQLATTAAEKEHVFEWVTVKVIRATKGNQQIFFYFICTLGVFMAAFIADVTVSIIFIPLIIKTCQILEIPAGTYNLGLTICINIGSILTPFSSGENIIISNYFGLEVGFYFQNLFLISMVILLITLVLLDHFYIRKEQKVRPERKLLLLDLLDSRIVIENRRRFYISGIGLIAMFGALFTIQFVPPFVFALIFGIGIVITTGRKITSLFKDIEWDVIFFFTSLFIIIGALNVLGFIAFLGDGIRAIVQNNVVLASLLILIFSSLMSAFLANSPTVLMFLPILSLLINDPVAPMPMAPLAVALLLGVNLGGNFLPQGAACDMMTLQISKKFRVPNFSFKRLLKVGGSFAGLHLAICCVYVTIFSLFFM